MLRLQADPLFGVLIQFCLDAVQFGDALAQPALKLFTALPELLRRLLLGSQATKVLTHSTIPVLVLR